MKYVDEFRSKELVRKIAEKIRILTPQEKINIMEVCGTHTQNFRRFGLDKLVPASLKFIAGPGCPVCVSEESYIDRAMQCAQDKNTIIATFGDMLRLPGTNSTLEAERAKGATVAVVYSALDALSIARQNSAKKVIFLAVGFETTAPTIALTILRAKKEKIKNLLFCPSLKLIPPAMRYLAEDKRLNISGFLCPGHVSSIIGTKPYEFIPKRYKIGCCVAGFEPVDILEGLYLLLRQIINKEPRLDNQYSRVVREAGNPKAQRLILKVFRSYDADWRGLGRIPESGLRIREEFSRFDVEAALPLYNKQYAISHKLKRCRCGDVIKGLIEPKVCPLFRKSCSPEHPYGPCMVSSEGACNAYYKYK